MHLNSLRKATYQAIPEGYWLWIAVVVLVLLLILEWWGLQRDIERAYHKAEVQQLRVELSEMWVRRQMNHQSTSMAEVAHINPIEWMAKPPDHYLGAFKQRPPEVRSVWVYETQHACLVYVFSDGEIASYHLQAKPSSVDLVASPCAVK